MAPTLLRFWRDDTAATSIEYALIAGFASIAIVAAVNAVGTSLNSRFQAIEAGLP
jgi:pilus assembly protein Flp/PilA